MRRSRAAASPWPRRSISSSTCRWCQPARRPSPSEGGPIASTRSGRHRTADAKAAWWRGRDVIAAFGAEPVHRYLPTHANGQAANAAYRWDPNEASYVAEALEILTLEDARVKQMTAFMIPGIFRHFGLPDQLPS
jgi:hypothetical protein